MKVYISVTRGVLAAILGIIVLTALLGGLFCTAISDNKNGDTNRHRMEFVNSIGCVVDEDSATSKSIVIPVEFNETYQNYNLLQNRAGFDLSEYKGCEVTVYTYRVLSYGSFDKKDEAQLNLIVYNGRIIGGDISTVRIDGVMLPLIRGEKNGKTAS